MTIEDLLKKVKAYLPEQEVEYIEKSYHFAEKAHEGQYRKSGEAYIAHPIEVAGILVNLQMDSVTIAAAFLHDVIEDTDITKEDIVQEFGQEVALLVEGVTKLKKIKYKSHAEQLAENHRKMLVAMAKDIRVMLIKLADRLHNMRTLKFQSEEKQRLKAEETLEIFAPLAHRLGISTIKWELEDISLRYLNPQQYYRIVQLMKQKRAEREEYIDTVREIIREKIGEHHITADISGRPKHIYSIYRKMYKQKKDFDEIYDLMAIRILVKDIRDCYAVLGIIHTCWKPMPGRFKDYIAMPKPNMYQSLHTTVINKGEPLEVQIRTEDMHRTAEYGVAAHWAYKEGKESSTKNTFDNKLTWFKDILESQQDANDAQEFMESLKMDLFSDLVFVFTPKGDVYELPAGSVPIDFAYRVHTEVGNRCVGAKVNGRIVTLDHVLKTGDIIEILTSKHSYGPSRDWIKIAKSSHAKSKIKQFFKKEKREESIIKGKELVELELKKQGYDLKKVLTEENIQHVAGKFNFTGEDDMFAAVGYSGITAAQISTRLLDKIRKEKQEEEPVQIPEIKPTTKRRKLDHGVRVKGVDNLLVRFSRCCNPVPGDEIVGFVTRGRGVSVHRASCPNLKTEDAEHRILPVEWEGAADQSYNVDIEITGMDRRGLLNEVLQAVTETKTNMLAVSGRADKHKIAHISMTVSIQNVDHLHKVVDKIKRLKDIFSVQRVMQ
ncbi:RelA/SpoT family protein [Bacillus horti]|uniref:GTP pyrophosphokinase n=1 Tax=Caldalkalibacillus horti TaxID=77523 RepID=A0ABT9VTQ7_9BACI|nr:bifunctional (p)ppGpp synthetase/guanosine-3',5'-bis(diphosphate) 3'-pyrophosphohydrolase [Bacillus horti]MDQ0164237.1 GTP pyrophosphokinase [Bacillus horti]